MMDTCDDEGRRARRRQTARMLVAHRDIPEHTVIDELVTLLEQIHKIEHAQDRTAITTIAERYGFDLWKAHHGRV